MPVVKFLSSQRTRTRAIEELGTCYVSNSGQFILDRNNSWEVAQTAVRQSDDLNSHPFFELSARTRAAARLTDVTDLDYIILVPTLRCDLSCSYCQVSRAPLNQTQFDWTDETLKRVLSLISSLTTPNIKIEFQGGEPTLRLDLIREVIAASERFEAKQFILCTNLSNLSEDLMALLGNPDVYVSTSLDGLASTHTTQRTGSEAATNRFLANAKTLIETFGPDKLSALPTIDQTKPPEPDELIEAYLSLGQSSIFLRPINYQGFARKRHATSKDEHDAWWVYYDQFIKRLIERNFADRSVLLEECYLSVCLQRIFQVGHDRHVDLRNPNPIGVDYILVDFDGQVYPTDEARMLSRSGVIDLAIGHIASGWDTEARELLDRHSTNIGDPACDSCAYQPYCGRDLIDDLSRYGTISLPRHETFFCQKHLRMFDLCMRLIYDSGPAVRYSVAKWMGLPGDQFPKMAEFE